MARHGEPSRTIRALSSIRKFTVFDPPARQIQMPVRRFSCTLRLDGRLFGAIPFLFQHLPSHESQENSEELKSFIPRCHVRHVRHVLVTSDGAEANFLDLFQEAWLEIQRHLGIPWHSFPARLARARLTRGPILNHLESWVACRNPRKWDDFAEKAGTVMVTDDHHPQQLRIFGGSHGKPQTIQFLGSLLIQTLFGCLVNG